MNDKEKQASPAKSTPPSTLSSSQQNKESWLSVSLDTQPVSLQPPNIPTTSSPREGSKQLSPRSPCSSPPSKLNSLLGIGDCTSPQARPRKNSITSLFLASKPKEASSSAANSEKGISIDFIPAEIQQLNKFLQFKLPINLKISSLADECKPLALDVGTITTESEPHKRFARRILPLSQGSREQGVAELFDDYPSNIEISQLAQLLHFKLASEDNQQEDSTTTDSSLQQHKRNFSGYDSNDYNDILATMKKLFILAIKRGIYESILCTFIMRDVYSLMQQLQAATTTQANASTNASIKAKIIQLTTLVYRYFIDKDCPFAVNFSDEVLTTIRKRWQIALYPESSDAAQEKQIPPLEIMLDALNGLIADTQIHTEIGKLNSESKKAMMITDVHKCLTDDDKKSLYALFDALTCAGCPRHCPPLFSHLESVLELKGEPLSLHRR